MYAKYQCFIINTSEDMSQVKVFVTDRQTEVQTDEWVLMSPAFAKLGEQKQDVFVKYGDPWQQTKSKSYILTLLTLKGYMISVKY